MNFRNRCGPSQAGSAPITFARPFHRAKRENLEAPAMRYASTRGKGNSLKRLRPAGGARRPQEEPGKCGGIFDEWKNLPMG